MATDTKLIVNLTRGNALCTGTVADRPLARMRGLLGRTALPAGQGILLRPAPSIHTAFMRFPIDALFLDARMTVLSIKEALPPWRVASSRRARAVLELAAGECGRLGVRVGDRLAVRDHGRQLPRWRDPQADAEDGFEDARPAARSSTLARSLAVLVISGDRRFRSVISVLLTRRGCAVTTTEGFDRLAELGRRLTPDVVVIEVDAETDVTARARMREAARPAGVVLVEEAPVAGSDGRGTRVLDKWGPFEGLFAAIEAAGGHRRGGRDARS